MKTLRPFKFDPRGRTVVPYDLTLNQKEDAMEKMDHLGDLREFQGDEYSLVQLDDEIVELVPLATHLQRGIGSLSVETQLDARVDADELIEIIENAMSAPVYDILKRVDEQSLVIQAVNNPKFVEDSVRSMLKQFVERYKDILPDNTLITAKQINQESVHQHDAFAEEVILLKELVEELQKNG